jgi:hypothetical protein
MRFWQFPGKLNFRDFFRHSCSYENVQHSTNITIKITKTSFYLKKMKSSDLNERKFEVSKCSRDEGSNVVFWGAEGTSSLNILVNLLYSIYV